MKKKDHNAVMSAIVAFYVALNQCFAGNLEPMKAIWSHADDVTYMGPDGEFNVGWKQVLNDWELQTAMKLGGTVHPVDMQTTVGADIAIVNNYEHGENTNVEGEIQTISIRATNIFRKEDGEWKMIGHHTDLIPRLVDMSR